MEQKKNNLIERRHNLNNKIRNLREEVKSLRDKIAGLEKQNDQARTDYDRLLGEGEREAANQRIDDIKPTKQKILELRKMLDDKQSSIDELLDIWKSLREEAREFSNECKEALKSAEKLNEETENLSYSIGHYGKIIENLTRLLE